MKNIAFIFFFYFLTSLSQAYGDAGASNSREEAQNADENHKVVCWRDTRDERELETCISNQANEAEDKLNRTYKDLMASLPNASRIKLREAQRAWVTWRERECAAQVQFVEECVNGCGVPSTMHVVCMTNEAETRTGTLQGYSHREP